MNRFIAALFIGLLTCGTAFSQTVTSSPSPPCSAFGTIAGTCLQGAGALGTPSSGTLTNATGLPTTSLTGVLQAAQMPALTGDVTTVAGALAATLTTAQPAVHTWALAQTFTVAPVFTDASASRTALGLGTAATVNTGTSGATIPLLNGTNTFSGSNTFSATSNVFGATGNTSSNVLVNGAASGSSGGAYFGVQNGGSVILFLGTYSAIFGGTYDNTATIASGATGLRLNATGTTSCATGLKTDATGLLSCVASSARFKTSFSEIGKNVSLDLHPSEFELKTEPGIKHVGLIAEEVEKLDKRLVFYDAQGKVLGVDYFGVVAQQAAIIQDLFACQSSWKCRIFGIPVYR